MKPEKVYCHRGWIGWEDWLGCQPENNAGIPEKETTEVTIECKCGGRIKNCLECDGKGYYIVHLLPGRKLHAEAKIWRRIQIQSDVLLSDFHRILQTTMGWTNSHLHQFIKDGKCYSTSGI